MKNRHQSLSFTKECKSFRKTWFCSSIFSNSLEFVALNMPQALITEMYNEVRFGEKNSRGVKQ